MLRTRRQNALAAAAGVAASSLGQWARGERVPEPAFRAQLEQRLEVPAGAWDEPNRAGEGVPDSSSSSVSSGSSGENARAERSEDASESHAESASASAVVASTAPTARGGAASSRAPRSTACGRDGRPSTRPASSTAVPAAELAAELAADGDPTDEDLLRARSVLGALVALLARELAAARADGRREAEESMDAAPPAPKEPSR